MSRTVFLVSGSGDGDDLDIGLLRGAEQVPEDVLAIFGHRVGTIDDEHTLRCTEFGQQHRHPLAENHFER